MVFISKNKKKRGGKIMATSNFKDQGHALTELNKLALELIDIEKYSDVRALLNNIASSAKEVLKVDLIELYEYNQDQDRYEQPPIRAGERLEPNVPKVKIYQDDAVWKLIHHSEPLYRERTQDEIIFTADYDIPRENIPADRFVIREKIQSTALIPLRAEKKSMGLMFANYRTTQSFDKEQRKLIELFAKQAAIAIKNARLFQQISTQTQALTELNKLAHRLVSVEEYSETSDLLKRIAESAKEVLKADLVDLYEYQQDTKKYKLPQISFGERWHPSVLKEKIYEDDTVFQLIDRSKPVYEKDTQSGAVFTAPYTVERKGKPKERFVDRENILSAAAVPLRTGTESMGLMFVNYRTSQTFPKEQQELIELFANQAAITIKNARLFQQTSDQTKALTELNQIAYNLISIEEVPDAKKLLEKIAESAREVLKADLIELYEYRQDQNKYELPPISKGKIQDKTVLKDEIFQDDAVFQLIHRPEPRFEKESQAKSSIFIAPYNIDREHQPAERFVVREDIESTAAIPLRTRNESMGLMFANYRTPQTFSREQQELIELFARQAAIAIKNARAYYYVNKRRESLVKIGQKLTAGIHLQEDQIYELVYEQASKMLGFENLSIALFDKSTSTMKFVLAIVDGRRVNIEQEQGWEPRQGGKGKTEKIIQSKEYLLLPTLEEVRKTGFSPTPGHKDYEGKLASSWLGVPMFIGEEVLGVLATYHYGQDYFYNDDDIEILQALADQAAIAIENARLYYDLRNVNHRQRALVEFGSRLGSKISEGEAKILEFIHEQAKQFMDTNNMYIALYDDTTNTVHFKLAFKDGKRIEIQSRRAGKGRTEEIIQTGRAIFIATRKESEEWYRKPGKAEYIKDPLASWIGVPMKVENKVIGVVATYHPTKDYVYSNDDLRILQSLTDLATIALENAKLYQQLGQKIKELEQAQEKIAEEEAVITRTTIAADFVHRLNNLTGTIPIWVDQIRDEIDKEKTESSKIIDYLDKIYSDVNGLLRAVEQLKFPYRKQPIDIILLLESILNNLRVYYRNEIESGQIKILHEIQPSLKKVLAVPSIIVTALTNIITNGMESILQEREGKLIVKAINYTNETEAKWVKIEVKDTGNGISDENKNKIFTPFFTTKGEGRGYGLWRAKTIIENLGGIIEFESQEGKGATFTLLLPSILKEN